MRIEQEQKLIQSQKIAPTMIAASNILRLSVMELHQAIRQEQEENPAFIDPEEDDPCEACGQPGVLCMDCPNNPRNRIDSSGSDIELTVYDTKSSVLFSPDDEDPERDRLSNVSSQVSLEDILMPLVHTIVSEDKFFIAEYLILNINDSGYLELSAEQAALDLNVSIDEIEEVLAAVHTLEPPGIGARDLRECLHIQLLRLAEDDKEDSVALQIVSDHWDELTKGKLDRIARRLRLDLSRVVEAANFIKNYLTPYPRSLVLQSYDAKMTLEADGVRPDIIVTRNESGLSVEIVGYDEHYLQISSRYLKMYQDIKEGKEDLYSESDKNHVLLFVERAKSFVNHINQRKRTLKRIAEYVVDYQQGFMETSSKSFIRPLTRTMVAESLGLHESTVSRASSNKYVQLPEQGLVPFETLFDVSASLKDIIVDMIAQEDPRAPLSDQQIAKQLKAKGYDIARRTVAKYREDEKILSSRNRRI